MSNKAQIRRYMVEMLKQGVDVGGRVFVSRGPSPVFLEELPVVLVSLSGENVETVTGGINNPTEVISIINTDIAVVVEDIPNGNNVNVSQHGEDLLDYLTDQVLMCFAADRRMQNLLQNEESGLTHGFRFLGMETYDVDTQGERKIIATDIKLGIPFQRHLYPDTRLKDWKTYHADIIRVGSDEHTVDRVLMSAEGELNDG